MTAQPSLFAEQEPVPDVDDPGLRALWDEVVRLEGLTAEWRAQGEAMKGAARKSRREQVAASEETNRHRRRIAERVTAGERIHTRELSGCGMRFFECLTDLLAVDGTADELQFFAISWRGGHASMFAADHPVLLDYIKVRDEHRRGDTDVPS